MNTSRVLGLALVAGGILYALMAEPDHESYSVRVRDPATGITRVKVYHPDGRIESWRERDDGTRIEGSYSETRI